MPTLQLELCVRVAATFPDVCPTVREDFDCRPGEAADALAGHRIMWRRIDLRAVLCERVAVSILEAVQAWANSTSAAADQSLLDGLSRADVGDSARGVAFLEAMRAQGALGNLLEVWAPSIQVGAPTVTVDLG